MTDKNHSIKRCKSGLAAAEALRINRTERAHWERMIAYWREQLAYAEKRDIEGAS